jgi:hypothetical protein
MSTIRRCLATVAVDILGGLVAGLREIDRIIRGRPAVPPADAVAACFRRTRGDRE